MKRTAVAARKRPGPRSTRFRPHNERFTAFSQSWESAAELEQTQCNETPRRVSSEHGHVL
jgi:hypothetical protein